MALSDMATMDLHITTNNHDEHAHHRMAAKQHEHAGHHPHQGHDIPVSGWADAATPDGHKMLQYRDLQSLPQPDQRPPRFNHSSWVAWSAHLDIKW